MNNVIKMNKGNGNGQGISPPTDLPNEDARLWRIEDVAAYCQISVGEVGGWVKRGVLPGPIKNTDRYDREAIDEHLDKLSGL